MKSLSYEEYTALIKNAPDTEVKPGCVASCPVTVVLDMLQGKWKNHVMFIMCSHDTIRFNKLKSKLPQVTNAALTNTLRELELCGLVNRVQYNEIPPRVEYSLTEKGRDLMPVFHQMYEWSVKHWDVEEFKKYKDYSSIKKEK